jgi:putative ABC transport system permease protein
MIRLNHADKYYNRGNSNELHVMNDISLELPERGMVAVFGQSGCGKTTLLNAIGGLDKLTSGTISVFEKNMAKNTDDLRNQYIGYIFQNYNLSKNETVFENVANALRLCGMTDDGEIRERVMAALKNVGMEKFRNRQPDTLSGGQQQRVAIARALVKNPAIILADEPTGNLDEANTVLVMDILKQLSREHLVVLVTHEANLVDYYCDRVIQIVDGKISSIRDNENATGYSGRGKNDIYLGELTRQESSVPGVKIEYYGEMREELRLRIVSVDGKLYLKNDSPNVKILDECSEIKLHQGVFEAPDTAAPVQSIDMSALAPIEGKNFGKLFSFRSAVASGYRENFSKG